MDVNTLFLALTAVLAAFAGGLVVGGRRREEQPEKRTVSQSVALRVLTVDAAATFGVLGLCGLAILRNYEGALPYLTALIGALQAVTGVVLSAYYKKSTMENTKGGIVYDAAMSGKDTGDL